MARAVSVLALTFSAFVLTATAGAERQSGPVNQDLVSVLSSLAERTQQYYDRFISIICTETVHQQDLKFNLEPSGRPRVTVYELSVSRNPNAKEGSDFRVGRSLLEVNGRRARKNEQPGCTDPKTGTPEPLAFLLARNQPGYRFALSDRTDGGPPGTRALDFMQWPPERVSVKWTDNCFDAEGGGQQGRIWYEPGTFDILRVDARLSTPFLVPLPHGLQWAHPSIRVERSEVTVRFERVKFEKPDEVVLLPESIETLTVFRGVPSLRTAQKLTNFRRFLSETTIRPPSL